MVVFDWNGTVVLDADRAWESLNAALREQHVAEVPRSAFTTEFRLPMADMFRRLGVAGSEVAVADATWNRRMTTSETTLRPGAVEAIEALHGDGVWLGVVSAAAAAALAHDRSTLGVPDRWGTVLAPAEDKTTVLRALRHHADVAYYVGDTAYDMRCAAASGYVPVGVGDGYAPDEALWEAGATHVLRDLRDLVTLVRGSGSARERAA